MRIALVHNDTAGDASYKTRDLQSLLESVGHSVVAFDKKTIRKAVKARCDVVVAAGGDGTVASVALAIHKSGRDIPLYILPTGTANNIATSLGIPDDVPEVALALDDARPDKLAIGVVKARWGKRRFVEGAGFGFIGTMLERDGTMRERLGRAKRAVMGVFRHLTNEAKQTHGVARLVREQPAVRCRIRADGEDLDGTYIAAEVMNIQRLGPSVGLAPNADATDKRFDLYLVPVAERNALAEWIEARESAEGAPPGIHRRVKRVELPWPIAGGHVDDEPWPAKKQKRADPHARIKRDGRIAILLP